MAAPEQKSFFKRLIVTGSEIFNSKQDKQIIIIVVAFIVLFQMIFFSTLFVTCSLSPANSAKSCFGLLASETKNTFFCELSSNPGSCIRYIAKSFQDVSLCEEAKGMDGMVSYRNSCIKTIAYHKCDTSLCVNILEDDSTKDSCYSIAGIQTCVPKTHEDIMEIQSTYAGELHIYAVIFGGIFLLLFISIIIGSKRIHNLKNIKPNLVAMIVYGVFSAVYVLQINFQFRRLIFEPGVFTAILTLIAFIPGIPASIVDVNLSRVLFPGSGFAGTPFLIVFYAISSFVISFIVGKIASQTLQMLKDLYQVKK